MTAQKTLFIKKLIIGLVIGVALFLIMISQNAFKDASWWLIPVEAVLCLLYGTGWVFGANLMKKVWRKMLRAGKNATIWQAVTGRGLVFGILSFFMTFAVGSVAALFVGNFLMIKDIFSIKKGVALASSSAKFDGDLDYSDRDRDIDTLESAVHYNETVNKTNSAQCAVNQEILDDLRD